MMRRGNVYVSSSHSIAAGENVVGDQVLCARKDPRLQLLGWRRLHHPRLRRLHRVEERAVESDHTQQI
jgi:hypothetical protein